VLSVALVVLALVFAVQAMRARQLISSALWLAGVSAMVATLLFLYGAQLVAIVELSVGAGLVTVLFVFAINIAGDETRAMPAVPPWPVTAGFTFLFVLLLGWFLLSKTPFQQAVPAAPEVTLQIELWNARGLDLIVQVVLIFSGVLGLLGLLAEVDAPLGGSMAAEVMANRELEMNTEVQSMVSQLSDDQDTKR
jgi:NADH:ubiquinone oxidoreductase subunit 6 (subunit J)